MSGDILDDIDAAIEDHEDYVEWHGSADAATWAADGSHEVDTGGHYYGDDDMGQHRHHPWHEILQDALSRPLDREVFDPSWVRRISPSVRAEAADRSRRLFQAWDDVTMRQLAQYQQQINPMHLAHRAFTTTYDAIVDEAGRVSWQRLTEPDPAEFVRETVATWQPGPTPARPIEAVLRDIVKEQG